MSVLARGWKLRAWTWGLMVFLYAPIVVLILFSFNAAKSQAVWKGFTLSWYGVALHNEVVLAALKRSAAVASLTTLVATAIGTLAGLGLARRFPGRGATTGLLYLPIMIPEIVLAVSLLTFFSVADWQLSPTTVVLSHVVFCTSYVAIVVRARLAGFDQTLEEAARDLGAGAAGVFWRVKFPLILPGIVAGALLAFTVSLDDYLITAYVRPAAYDTLPVYIYGQVRRGVTPEVNAVSTLMLVVTAVTIVIASWLARRGGGSQLAE
jgi:spermidine/putrescine transport system permease protein